MRIKQHLFALGILAVAASPTFGAELVKAGAIPGTFSGSVAFTTEYFFRGVSQSDDTPALQGDISYSYDFGPVQGHAGIWGSNVKFTDADIELDYTVGVGGSINKFSWDLSGIWYDYPGSADSLNYDYGEVAISAGYDFGLFSVGAGINYSPNNFGDSGDAEYLHANVTIPLGGVVDLGLGVGRQYIEKNDVFGLPDYTDYTISLSTSIVGLNFTAAYTDTSMSDSECDDACGQFLLTLSKSF